jgi:hypothetical protein
VAGSPRVQESGAAGTGTRAPRRETLCPAAESDPGERLGPRGRIEEAVMTSTILLAVDDSAHSQRAADVCEGLATLTKYKVVVIHIH